MLTKTKIIETINKFPDEFTIDELIERLIIVEKIEKANKQSEEGKSISEDDLEKEMEKWFK